VQAQARRRSGSVRCGELDVLGGTEPHAGGCDVGMSTVSWKVPLRRGADGTTARSRKGREEGEGERCVCGGRGEIEKRHKKTKGIKHARRLCGVERAGRSKRDLKRDAEAERTAQQMRKTGPGTRECKGATLLALGGRALVFFLLLCFALLLWLARNGRVVPDVFIQRERGHRAPGHDARPAACLCLTGAQRPCGPPPLMPVIALRKPKLKPVLVAGTAHCSSLCQLSFSTWYYCERISAFVHPPQNGELPSLPPLGHRRPGVSPGVRPGFWAFSVGVQRVPAPRSSELGNACSLWKLT
jgi:hypothetical protein